MKVKIMLRLVLCFAIFPATLKAQYVHYGSLNNSLRNVAILTSEYTDPLISVYNPALLPANPGFGASIYMEKKYMVKELMQISAAAVIRVDNSVMSASLTHFGGPSYREQSTSLSYGREFGNLSTGFQLAFNNTSSLHSSILRPLRTRISLRSKLAENVFCSVMLVDAQALFQLPDSATIRTAAGFHISIGCRAGKQVYFGIESQKQEQRTPELTPMLLFSPSEIMVFRTAWSTRTGQPFLSAAWRIGELVLETGFSYHISLGISPIITFQYKEQKR